MKIFAVPSLALSCLLASACTSPVITHISGSGAGLAPPVRLAILAAEADGAPTNKDLNRLIEKSLAARGYGLAEDGPFILDAAFGLRAGTIAVFGKDAQKTLSPPQKKGFLSSCVKQVHRLTLSVLERASGAPVYQGAAEEAHCRDNAAESLPHLIDALAVDMAKPGVERWLPRRQSRK